MGDLIGALDLPSDSFLQLPSSKSLIFVANPHVFFIHRSSFKHKTQIARQLHRQSRFSATIAIPGSTTLHSILLESTPKPSHHGF
jgi:hypothetical protein